MKHVFQKGKDTSKPVLLLLHGTGGNELDLLPLAEIVDPEASVLSVRKMFREWDAAFFRRLAEGIFDEEDLIFRTKELNEFLDEAAKEYKFDRNNIVAIGYSNGANIAASLLFHYENALKGAVLHHPMVPRRGMQLANLAGNSVFIAAGTNDPICSSAESEELKVLLENANANVTMHWENRGHQLTMGEVEKAKEWYDKAFKEASAND